MISKLYCLSGNAAELAACLLDINILISTYADWTAQYKGRRSPLRGVHVPSPSDFESTETKLFRAGLKHYTANHERLIKGSRNSPNQGYHDQIDYERVCLASLRAASSTRALPLTSSWTSTTCTEASRSSSWTAGWLAASTATVSEWCGSLASSTSSVLSALFSRLLRHETLRQRSSRLLLLLRLNSYHQS